MDGTGESNVQATESMGATEGVGTSADDFDFPNMEGNQELQPEPVSETEQQTAQTVAETGGTEKEAQPNLGQNLTQDGQQPLTPEQEIAYLREQLNLTAGQLMKLQNGQQPAQQPSQQPIQQPKPTEQPQTPPMPKPGEVTTLDFLEGADVVETLSDPVKFNALLNKVATVAFTAAVNASQEQIMRKIPDIVHSSAQQQMEIHGMTEQFYSQNPDLVPYKQAVSMAAMQLHNENPGMSLSDLLKGAAEKTRSILRLTQVPANGASRQRKPAQPAGGSLRSAGSNRTQGEQQLSDLDRQIAELLDL